MAETKQKAIREGYFEEAVKITDFNRDMCEEERQYVGEEFDENR